jgi:integrase
MGRHPHVNKNLPPRMRARRRGKKTYYFFDHGGRPRKETPLGTDYIAAVQKWAKLNMSPSPVSPTVGFAIAKYISSREFLDLAAGTQNDYQFAINNLRVNFGDAPLDLVRPEHLRQYHALRCETIEDKWKGSKHRANREVSVLGMIFRFARDMGLTTNNPKEPVRLKKLPGRKNVTITDDMLEAVYDLAPQDLKDAIDLAYLIGQRPADVLKLADTDIKDGLLTFKQNKTGAAMTIEIRGDLASLIERIQTRKRSFSIVPMALLVDERGRPMTKAKLRSRFEAARTAAGIEGKHFQFRDLRRKAGADLRRMVGIEAAQDLLGHASVTMTEHYTGGRGRKVSVTPIRKTK